MDAVATHDFHHPPDRVWALLADFGNMDWLTTVFKRVETEGDGIGMLRRLYQDPDRKPAIHRLDALDHENRVLYWSIHQTVFIPVPTIDAETRVEALSEQRARVITIWRFEPPDHADAEELRRVTENWNKAALQQMERYLDDKYAG